MNNRVGVGVRLAAPVMVAAAALALSRDANAQSVNQRTDPALGQRVEDTRRDVATEVREEPVGKAGPLMANVKVGPSIGFGGLPVTAVLQLDAGYALIKGKGRSLFDGDLYAVVSPELQVGSGAVLTLPIGAQYDMPVPIRNVYVYPRAVAGYSAVLDPSDDGDSGDAFTIIPAAGVKYLPTEGINIGFEPFGLPIHLGNGDPGVQYRMMAYAGGNF